MTTRTDAHTCTHCGHTGPDVAERPAFVGGHAGDHYRTTCTDEVACWARWDTAQGLTGTYAQQLMAERGTAAGVA